MRSVCDCRRPGNHRTGGRASQRLAACLLVLCSGLWAGCSETALVAPDAAREPQAAFQQLAHLEVRSDRLYQAVAAQADAVGFSHRLELLSESAVPFTARDMELIEQSFMRSLKVMLFDLAPAHFWETHLARYYASVLQAPEAQTLVERYERLALDPASRLQELRRTFVTERLPDLLPAVRARSQTLQISHAAMVPTLFPGDQVILHRAAYHTAAPQRGDIIVYRYPDENGQRFVHRVIGIPGDRIEIRDQVVSVNGTALAEGYVQHTDVASMAGNVRDNTGPVTLPPDTYFVLGDNREESLDSRFLGPVGRDHILGQVLFIYWSVDPDTRTPRWGRLNHRVR